MIDLDELRKIAEEMSPEYGMACLKRESMLALLDRVEKAEGELDLMEQTLDLSKMVEDKVKKKLDWAERALQRVRELHTRDDGYCRACDRLYPCPTIRALWGDE